MLRTLLGEPPRFRDESLEETVKAIESFIRLCRSASDDDSRSVRYRTFAIWAEGLRRSLRELDESLFAARHFAQRIHASRWDDLTSREMRDYDLHVYFDKNAYIRVFSLLDKLGTLLNALLELRTEAVKIRFSYFTVLRRLRESGRFPGLTAELTALKERHRDAMGRLRMRRNMEIHYMNAELMDDLSVPAFLAAVREDGRLEDLSANMADAQEGWTMVRESLSCAFRFAVARLRRDGREEAAK